MAREYVENKIKVFMLSICFIFMIEICKINIVPKILWGIPTKKHSNSLLTLS